VNSTLLTHYSLRFHIKVLHEQKIFYLSMLCISGNPPMREISDIHGPKPLQDINLMYWKYSNTTWLANIPANCLVPSFNSSTWVFLPTAWNSGFNSSAFEQIEDDAAAYSSGNSIRRSKTHRRLLNWKEMIQAFHMEAWDPLIPRRDKRNKQTLHLKVWRNP